MCGLFIFCPYTNFQCKNYTVLYMRLLVHPFHLYPVIPPCTSSCSSSSSSPPPLQGEQFCSATHWAIFGPLCYLLFKDAVAVVGASKKGNTANMSKCSSCVAHAGCILAGNGMMGEKRYRNLCGKSRMLTKDRVR